MMNNRQTTQHCAGTLAAVFVSKLQRSWRVLVYRKTVDQRPTEMTLPSSAAPDTCGKEKPGKTIMSMVLKIGKRGSPEKERRTHRFAGLSTVRANAKAA